jgi:hypothetical protein
MDPFIFGQIQDMLAKSLALKRWIEATGQARDTAEEIIKESERMLRENPNMTEIERYQYEKAKELGAIMLYCYATLKKVAHDDRFQESSAASNNPFADKLVEITRKLDRELRPDG